ncbi:hypothetical protein PP613_26910 [Mycobacteroides abscessus]|nr:hypothetical protein [Mycobacteroides abscessus]MDM2412983.1 hypothetical protein [Mycobacteroides abscessus]
MSQPQPDAYQYAAMQLAWEQFEPDICVAWITHVGTVAAALRAWELAGGTEGTVSYLDLLYGVLADDPFARAAANELEALDRVGAEGWVPTTWELIAKRAATVAVPVYTATERCYRRAAVEYVLQENRLASPECEGLSTTDMLSCVQVYTAARVRWNAAGFELTICHEGDAGAATKAILRDVVEANPIARAGEAQLTQEISRAGAAIVDEEWKWISERAETLLTLSAIADLSTAL